MSVLRQILSDPALRVAAAAIFLTGAVSATFAPHVSVLAVRDFGLGDRGYAVLLVVSMLVSVGASIAVGIRSDQTANRRGVAVLAAAFWVAGLALMTFLPSTPAFVVAHAILIPLSASVFVQIFALARLAATRHPADTRDAILTTIRAIFALPFVLVLPGWAAAFRAGTEVMAIYPVSLVAAGAILALMLRSWPRDGSAGWEDRPSGLTFRSALAELSLPPVALRVLALGAVNVGSTLYIAVIGLLMAEVPGRGPPDAALFVGLVAGLEVPFMLALPLFVRGMDRPRQIVIGSAIYAVHMALLPVLAGSPLVWLLIVPAAAGAAVTLTVPIAYLQDLLATRPGTGAALISLQQLTGTLLAGGCFAIGTAVSGYPLVLFIGTAVMLAGAIGLALADRRVRASARPTR